jgi:hypothetical protein
MVDVVIDASRHPICDFTVYAGLNVGDFLLAALTIMPRSTKKSCPSADHRTDYASPCCVNSMSHEFEMIPTMNPPIAARNVNK